MSTVERNDPCPCGSGKKYKKCCLEKAEASRVPAPAPGAALLQAALQHHRAGRLSEAESLYREMLARRLDQPQALHGLGILAHHRGQSAEAVELLRQALRGKATDANVHDDLGLAYQSLARYEEAIACHKKALALRPEYVEAYVNLGNAYSGQDNLDEAVACFEKALTLQPRFSPAHVGLGSVLLRQGRVQEALSSLDRALALQPDNVLTHDIRLCALNYRADVTPAAVYQAARRYAQRIEAPLTSFWPRHANAREPERRLKVGYVSPDFRLHSVAFFMEPILAHHDKGAVEIYCYYNNTVHDEVTARLQSHADHWIPCRTLTDEQLAERIRSDGIDILVDLAGHTASNRLLVFARKPAPLQVTYLGYVATTGLSAMDYRLSHLDTDPEGCERYNSEKLYRLPHSLWCYRPASDLPAVAPRTPARRNGTVTFGSMNNLAKVSEATVAVWSALLQRVPESRLVMAGVAAGNAQRLLRERFAAQGIDAGRLELYDKMSYREFRELHGRIDIALDPFPHNGNTTTCESLYLGVPVITRIGDRFVARFGYHLLKTIGLSELAAVDETAYVAIAAALATDLDRLEALRQGMRSRLEASPLRDEAGMTRDLEAAYRAMWRVWCAAPAHEAAYRQALEQLQSGRPQEAAALFREILAQQPEHFPCLHMLGVAELHAGRPLEALRCLDGAVRINAEDAGAHYNRGLVLQALKQPGEAVASFDRALALKADFFEAWNNRGLALRDLGSLEEAAASYRRALEIKPEGIDALNNLGNIQRDLGRYDEALVSFDRVLALRPDYANGHNNRGTVLQAQCRFEEALAHHLHAQTLDGTNTEAHWNEGLCRLTLGELKAGFEKFEWRWKKAEYAPMRALFPEPPWLGQEEIAGKTILLWAEQGLGDALQFCRYVPMVAARGGRVLLGAQPALMRLLARLPGPERVLGAGEALTGYDLHCPLMSLPLVFGTTLETIPAAVPYLFAAEAKVAEWKQRLGPARGRRVGLAWSGNPEHKNDRLRSIALAAFAPLKDAGVELVSVQKEVRESDRAALAALGVRHYGEALADFEDTAALIAGLDLVIAVDTAVAHLAGALGKPVWILLPYSPDWRWLLQREDSPWYPTARLFRQPAIGDWTAVLQRVAAELQP